MAKKVLVCFLLFFSAVFVFSFRIEKIPLWSSDEGRYGEIAREMWETKDFVVPQFNYLDYLEKPVLAPFLTAMAFGAFGVNALSARLVAIVSALLGLCLTFLFSARILNRQTAFYSTVVLMTTMGYVLVGRFAVIDMLMTFLLSAVLFCLMTGYFRRQPGFYLGAYALAGFAFLTKGLIAWVLPGLVFFVFLFWMKDFKEILSMKLGWGILIAGVIVVPWFILVSKSEPEFFNVFIIEQHFSRFLTGGFGRQKPFWFFVPVLFAVSFPWSFFLPASIGHSLSAQNRFRRAASFLISWLAVIFIFFSIPKSKLPYYLLPISVPAAVLIGSFLSDWIEGKEISKPVCVMMQWSWKILTFGVILAAVGFNGYLLFWTLEEQTLALKPLLHIGTCLFVFGILTAYFFHCRKKRKEAVFSLAGMTYAGLIAAVIGMEIISPFQSSYAYAQSIVPYLNNKDFITVYASPDEFSDFPFYLKKRVIVVGPDRGTLTYEALEGSHLEEVSEWFWNKRKFLIRFNRKRRRIFCLMESDRLQILIEEGLAGYHIIREGHGKILISNFELPEKQFSL